MAPKVSEEHLEDRRNQILDAAVSTFSAKGFHQSTIEDIRLEAGLSRGAVYHYFKTKEDIIDGIRNRSQQKADDIFEEVAKIEGAGSSLMNLIDATLANMVSPQSIEANRLALFLWAESLVNQRIMDGQMPAFTPYLDVLAASVEEDQATGSLDPKLDPQAAARVIVGAMIGLQIQLSWEPGLDIQASSQALKSMITGGHLQPNTSP